MGTLHRKIVFVTTAMLVIGLFFIGCGGQDKISEEPEIKIDPNTTIGSLAEVFSADLVAVEGYGLVGGLNGTGSAECPPQIRAYLEQYILQQLPPSEVDVEKLLSSRDTAVVYLKGLMPEEVSKNRYFDVKVYALPGTQTTSLEGGWLYEAELKSSVSFEVSVKVPASAEGPVFIDTTTDYEPDKKIGYVLAGGKSLEEYKISLSLVKPDYKITNLIRNKLNERFGKDTANAVSPGQIELKVPAIYSEQKQRFISIVKSLYLTETSKLAKQRIADFIRKLAVLEEPDTSEIALEAIGKESLGKLAVLLNSSNEDVRLRAARCMLNMGNDEGLDAIRQIAMDKNSSYRVEALEAITRGTSRNDAAAISRRLLRDENFNIRLAAYEQLRKLDDISISQKLIASNFFLEQITQTNYKAIFVSRSGEPRIVLFGAPIYCRDNIFIQSTDGNITINAPPDQKYVSIIRKHPKRPNVLIQLKSSFELADIIQTLCEEPLKKGDQEKQGLGVSYAEMIGLLKQMSDKGAVKAEFHVGPLPKIERIVKK